MESPSFGSISGNPSNVGIIQRDFVADPAMPRDIVRLFFEYLKFNDKLVCSLVSKAWKNASDEDSSWRLKARLVQCDDENREAVSKHIERLSNTHSLACSLLQIPVKTAVEFEKANTLLKLNEKHYGRDVRTEREQISKEIDRKKDLLHDITIGLFAVVQLYLVKRVAFGEVEKFATILERNYGQNFIWVTIIHQLLKAERFQEALHLFETELKGRVEGEGLLKDFIQPLCEQNQIEEALDFFKRNYKKNPYVDCLELTSENAFDIIRKYAYERKQFHVVEKLIEIASFHKKAAMISELMQAYQREDKVHEVKVLFDQYYTFLTSLPHTHEHNPALIEIYLQTGNLAMAWSIAMKAKDKDKSILNHLHNGMLKWTPHHREKITELQAYIKIDTEKSQKRTMPRSVH